MKTAIVYTLPLPFLASTAFGMPMTTRAMLAEAMAVVAAAAGDGGAPAVLEALPAEPFAGGAPVVEMALDAASGGGAAAMPATGPGWNLPVFGWQERFVGAISGISNFIAAHPVAVSGAVAAAAGGVAFYNSEPEGLDWAFEGFACYHANLDDYQEILQNMYGECTSFTRSLEWEKRRVALMACSTGTRPYQAQALKIRVARELKEAEERAAKAVLKSFIKALLRKIGRWRKHSALKRAIAVATAWMQNRFDTVADALAGALGDFLVNAIILLIEVISFLMGLSDDARSYLDAWRAQAARTLSATGHWFTRGAAAAMATMTTMGNKLVDSVKLCVDAKPILFIAAAFGTMVLVFWAYGNRSNEDNETDKIDGDHRAEDPTDEEATAERPAKLAEQRGEADPNDKEDMAARPANLAERREEAAVEEMDDSGRTGGRDGAAQAEAPQPLPRHGEECHDQRAVAIMGTPLVPPAQHEMDTHDHDMPTAAATLRTGAVPGGALNEEVPGLDAAQRNAKEIFPPPSTGNSNSTGTNSTTTIVDNAAMGRTMMMSSTGTNTNNVTTTISTNNATEVLKRLQAVAGKLNPGNALHVVKALAEADGGDKITVFCNTVGLTGPLFDLCWDYNEATQHTLAGLNRNFTALEIAQLTQLHKIFEELRVEGDELCGTALLCTPGSAYRTLLPQGDWRAVAISGDSNFLLLCDGKGSVYTGKRTELLKCALEMGGRDVIRSFAISDDGAIMVAAADKGSVHVSHCSGDAGTWTKLDSSEGKWVSVAWCNRNGIFLLIQDDQHAHHYSKDIRGKWALRKVGKIGGSQKVTGLSASASGNLLVATATYKPDEVLGNFVSHDLGRTWHPKPYTLEAENEEAKRALEAELEDKTTGVKPKVSACSPLGDRAVIASITGHIFMTWDYGTTWHRLQAPEIPAGTGWPSVQWLETHPKGGPRILATHIHGALWESSVVPATRPANLTWESVLNDVPRAFYAGSAASTDGSAVLLATRQTSVNRFIENFASTVEQAERAARNKSVFSVSGKEQKKITAAERRKGKRGGGGGGSRETTTTIMRSRATGGMEGRK